MGSARGHEDGRLGVQAWGWRAHWGSASSSEAQAFCGSAPGNARAKRASDDLIASAIFGLVGGEQAQTPTNGAPRNNPPLTFP